MCRDVIGAHAQSPPDVPRVASRPRRRSRAIRPLEAQKPGAAIRGLIPGLGHFVLRARMSRQKPERGTQAPEHDPSVLLCVSQTVSPAG